MPTLMTQSEYADHRGVSQATVSNYLKKGKIPKSCMETVEIDGRAYKKIDAEKADAALVPNIDVRKQRDVRNGPGGKGKRAPKIPENTNLPDNPESGKGPTMAEATRIKEIYKANLAKLDYEERVGKLCPRIEFEAALKMMGREIRDMMNGIGQRLKMKLAAEKDPENCARILNDELYRVQVAAIPAEYHEKVGIDGGGDGDI